MATATLDELIYQSRDKGQVLNSNFVTDSQIITYLNEARRQLREQIVTADDSYYQATLDFSISADPSNLQALPATFWKLRGVDAFAGDRVRQSEIYAREFRNRFEPGVGYYFGGDGNSIVIAGWNAEQANPFRIYYTPKPLPFAAQVPGIVRSIAHDITDGTNVSSRILLANAAFSAADVGGTLVLASTGVGVDGTYTILAVETATRVQVFPTPAPSQVFAAPTTAVLTDSAAATRTFAVAPADLQASGFWVLQNANFGAGDAGSFLTVTINAPNGSYSGTYQILVVSTTTTVQVTPAIPGNSPALTGTATVSRQPANTEHAIDLTEDNFVEYFSVRAGMTIARKKRQDTLVAQLAAERIAIEDRIAALSRMRQSEPQQAPVLWGKDRRRVFSGGDDLDV